MQDKNSLRSSNNNTYKMLLYNSSNDNSRQRLFQFEFKHSDSVDMWKREISCVKETGSICETATVFTESASRQVGSMVLMT